MTQIFISYRRADSQAIADRIHDHIAHIFGADNVFQDVEDIPPGVDFREYLAKAVGASDVLLVIIGNHWLDITDEHGKRRLDDSADFVRIEVENGLKRDDVLVIPIFVDGATMPSAPSLPPTLRSLTYRNAIAIRHNPYFEHDIERLITRIKEQFTRKKTPPWIPIALIFFTLMAIFSMVLLYAALADDNDDSAAQSSAQPSRTVTVTNDDDDRDSPSSTPDTRPTPNTSITQATFTTSPSNTSPPLSATDTPSQVVSEPSTLSPTILYPNGTRFELFYNATSFYIWNPNRLSYNVSAISFQAINTDNEYIGERFQGTEWTQYYVLERTKCYRIEVVRSENYLRPDQCSGYNAELTHIPNDSGSFWIPRENVTQFIVYWDDEEIARCQIEDAFCEIYTPN